METLREKVESRLTLPEFLDSLGIDFEDLWDMTLSEVFDDRRSEIEEYMEDEYGI